MLMALCVELWLSLRAIRCCISGLLVAIDRILVLTNLVWETEDACSWAQMTNRVLLVGEIYLSVIGSIDGGTITSGAYASIAWLATNVTLSVKSLKLWLVLYEIVLAVLQNSSLIVKTSEHAHTLTLWLRIFISIFHLFLSVLNVTWSDWLDVLV